MQLRKAAFAAKTATARAAAGRFYRELLANERSTPEALLTQQNELARDCAAAAMRESPLYRRVYRERGLSPENLTDSKQWARLPVIDRAMVKTYAAELATREAKKRNIRPALTGGSTGEPLRTMHDARIPSLALSWRMYSWWGIKPYDDLARIGRWSFGRSASLKNSLSWWPTRQVYLDAAVLSNESMTQFQRSLTRIRPKLLEGYVGALLAFADFLEDRGLRVPAPIAVASTAAPLTTSARLRLEEIFGAPVYDEYRASEFGWIAGECERRDGLHIFADVHRIETVGEDGHPVADGHPGDLVITDLRNRVFPLIRYRTGDKGTLRGDSCPCGRSLPLMEQPQGRTNDVIRLPSGRVLAHLLTGLFSAHPEAVRIFQIHQHRDYSITIRVVQGHGPDVHLRIESAVQLLRDRIHGEVPVRVDYVDSLPYTQGKIRYVISEAPPR